VQFQSNLTLLPQCSSPCRSRSDMGPRLSRERNAYNFSIFAYRALASKEDLQLDPESMATLSTPSRRIRGRPRSRHSLEVEGYLCEEKLVGKGSADLVYNPIKKIQVRLQGSSRHSRIKRINVWRGFYGAVHTFVPFLCMIRCLQGFDVFEVRRSARKSRSHFHAEMS
jgi:hypothetical protein